MVGKNIENILKYLQENPNIDINAEEAVRMFIDASEQGRKYNNLEQMELKKELIERVNRYEQVLTERLTNKDLGINENSALYQLLVYLGENAKTIRVTIDKETKDYLRTLASATLSIYQNDRSRRLGNASIQRLHANDTELSSLTELKEKVSKKNIEPELQKIAELLYIEVRIANSHNMLLNFDMSMNYSPLETIQLTDDQEYNNTRRLLKDRVDNLNRYLAKHQDVDINANEITEILLDSAKVIQKDQAHESKDTQEIINGIIDLSQTAVNRLLNTDLQLEKNSSLCQLILQLTGNAVIGTPAVEEQEEEYIKNLAKISLFTRQEDRNKRINLDNNHKIYDNESEYQTIKEQREKYKQNHQKGIYATLTDCLFAEITKAKTENKIYSFSLPFSLPELKKVEVENKEADKTQELIKRIQGVNQYLIDNPDNNVNMVELAGLYIDATKEVNKEELNTTIHTLSDTVQERMKKKNRMDTPLNILMNKLSNSALNHEKIVSPLEEEYLKELISANAFIYEQQERRENGEELHLFDNKEQLQTLNSKQYTVRFKEPNIQSLAKELLEEVQTAYQEDKIEKSKVEEENSGKLSSKKVKELKKELKSEISFLKDNPEAFDAEVIAGLFIDVAKAENKNVDLNIKLNQLWTRFFYILAYNNMEETTLAETLTHLYKSARSKKPAISSFSEKEHLLEVINLNAEVQRSKNQDKNGEVIVPFLKTKKEEFEYLQQIHQNTKFSQALMQTLTDRLFTEIETTFNKYLGEKANKKKKKTDSDETKIKNNTNSNTTVQEKTNKLINRLNGVTNFLKENPEADINAVELADLFIESAKIEGQVPSTLNDATKDLYQVSKSRMEKMQIEETAVAKTLINLANSAINNKKIVKPEEENFLKDIVRINFYIQQQQKKRENGETLRLFDNESEYNQIVAQSQNIHFSNPEIGTQVEQLVNEIKLAYQTNQIKPKQGVQNQPDNVSDLSIQEMAIQIYNQRKIMQAIAGECQTLEEYLARIGEEVTIMPSNDEIEAEVVKIKR